MQVWFLACYLHLAGIWHIFQRFEMCDCHSDEAGKVGGLACFWVSSLCYGEEDQLGQQQQGAEGALHCLMLEQLHFGSFVQWHFYFLFVSVRLFY